MLSSPLSSGGLVVRRVEDDDGPLLELNGVVDEHADLSFMGELRGRVRMHLGGLRRINSFGVRTWIAAIGTLPIDARLDLIACPPQFVDQINMLKGFLGPARVVSFLATYECEQCLEEHDHLIDADDCRAQGRQLPTDVTCPHCGGAMEPDVIEDLFLRFLRA